MKPSTDVISLGNSVVAFGINVDCVREVAGKVDEAILSL